MQNPKLHYISFLMLFLLQTPFFGVAQYNNIQFENITVDNGLSNSRPNAIVEDHKGFLWVGTRSGLNRYDGYQFKHYNSDKSDSTSISGDDVSYLCTDKDGGLWVACWEGGLNKYLPETDNFIRYNNDHRTSSNTIRTLGVDKNGMVWIGTYGSGVYRFNPKTEKFTQLLVRDKGPQNRDLQFIESMHIHGDTVWVAAIYGGVGYCLLDSDELHPALSKSQQEQVGEGASAVCLDKNNNLWIGCRFGKIFLFNPQAKELEQINGENGYFESPSPYVWKIIADHEGNIWIGTRNGLLVINPDNYKSRSFFENKTEPNALISDNIFTMYEDSRNIIWLGCWHGGIAKYDAHYFKFNSFPLDQFGSGQTVFGIIQKSERYLWLATQFGLIRLDKKNNRVEPFEVTGPFKEIINNNPVFCLDTYKGDLLIGGHGGLFQVNTETGEAFRPFPDLDSSGAIPVIDWRVLKRMNNGEIWLGNWIEGIVRIIPEENRVVSYKYDPNDPKSIQSDATHAFYQDSENRIWIGTLTGLSLYEPETGTFENIDFGDYDQNYSKIHYGIRALTEVDNELWLGSNRGLISFNKDTKETHFYSKNEGLADEVIYGVLSSEKEIWFSTNYGITSLNTENNHVRNYDIFDGIIYNEFNFGAYCKSWENELFFGSIMGLYYFKPFELRDNPFVPPVYITSFNLRNSEEKLKDNILHKANTPGFNIELGSDQRSFTLEFSALNFTSAAKSQYQYMLEGFDKTWIYTAVDNRVASYTNLDPGIYTFKVKASNNDGVWNVEGSKVSIIIKPSFWQTNWFKALTVSILALILWTAYRIRVNSVEKRSQVLEEKVGDRTREIISKNKEIEFKNEELAIRNKQLEDSINYGKKIQQAILPNIESLRAHFNEAEILFLPRESVSGDFYWYGSRIINGTLNHFLAVVDCTGHGVPGAFMSLIGARALNFLINERKMDSPAEILHELNDEIVKSLKQKSTGNYDGMDVILIRISQFEDDYKICFAGAKRPFIYIDNEEKLHVLKGDRKSIGGYKNLDKKFEEYELILEESTKIYLTTDGFQDQNNIDREKFGKTRFFELLQEQNQNELFMQFAGLSSELALYMQGTEQRDDITVLGVKL